MSLHALSRISTKALNLLAFFVVLIMASGCSSTGFKYDAGLYNGLSSNQKRDGQDVTEDLFLVSIDAQRAYRESRWIEAVRLYQEIVEHVPNDAVTWFRLANTYAQQGAFERAIHAYEQSLSLDKEQPKAWFNLSTAYLLRAQSAMHHAYSNLRSHDPAKDMVKHRIQLLSNLVHNRLEESTEEQVGLLR